MSLGVIVKWHKVDFDGVECPKKCNLTPWYHNDSTNLRLNLKSFLMWPGEVIWWNSETESLWYCPFNLKHYSSISSTVHLSFDTCARRIHAYSTLQHIYTTQESQSQGNHPFSLICCQSVHFSSCFSLYSNVHVQAEFKNKRTFAIPSCGFFCNLQRRKFIVMYIQKIRFNGKSFSKKVTTKAVWIETDVDDTDVQHL